MHTLRLPLAATPKDCFIIDKRYGIIARIHNQMVKHVKKLLRVLKRDEVYQSCLEDYRKQKALEEDLRSRAKKATGTEKDCLLARAKQAMEEKNTAANRMNTIREELGLTEYGLQAYSSVMGKHFKKNVSSMQVQVEASRVWKGADAVLFGNGKDVHYKKKDDFRTICGKNPENGVKFILEPDHDNRCMDCHIDWLGLSIPVRLDLSKADLPDGRCYAYESLSSGKLKYCEIVRLWFKNGWHYYVNLYLDGEAPKKVVPGKSIMGIDEGTSTVAAASETTVLLEELAPECLEYDREIARLQGKIDASVRRDNPERYRADGTPKKKSECRDAPPWKFSKNCRGWKDTVRELYRKKTGYTDTFYGELTNRMVRDASTFVNEPMDFRALAKRSKKTERRDTASAVKKKDGTVKMVCRYKRKKRFGKSVNDRSPAVLAVILKRKCKQYSLLYYETDRMKYRASQYDHARNVYEKVPLSARSKEIGGHTVQRDLYSAFLQSCRKNSTHPDRTRCMQLFDTFVKMQDDLIRRMKEKDLSRPACFGF